MPTYDNLRATKAAPVTPYAKYRVTLSAKVLLQDGRRYYQNYKPQVVQARSEDEALDEALGKVIPPTAEDFNVKSQAVEKVGA